MGRLVNGEWLTDDEVNKDDTDEFKRDETTFRDWVEDGDSAQFPVEEGRYHLYISRACPWAHGAALLRKLKGLEDAVSMSIVEPVRIDNGWEFSDRYPDPLHGADYLRDIYVKADPEYTGRVTVPVLWDKKEETIVNNESKEIMRMFDVAFDGVARKDVTFYPEGYKDEVDRVIEGIYDPINNGVYRAGFAGTQEAYESAVTELFDALDYWDDKLENQRYLCGSVLTEADWRMFPTLYRFDAVYHTHFKCNVRRLVDYPNLWNYLKELYQVPGVRETCNMEHVKKHYYMSHRSINPKQIVPKGPAIDFEEPHNRDGIDVDSPKIVSD
ncbi:MAG: glutathione S-transferase family protein [Halobacteria archaeon]|nr:glutathione S-transferase family protein [Halobacteria archaeon]